VKRNRTVLKKEERSNKWKVQNDEKWKAW